MLARRNEDGKCGGLDSCGSFRILLGDVAASEMWGNDAFNRDEARERSRDQGVVAPVLEVDTKALATSPALQGAGFRLLQFGLSYAVTSPGTYALHVTHAPNVPWIPEHEGAVQSPDTATKNRSKQKRKHSDNIVKLEVTLKGIGPFPILNMLTRVFDTNYLLRSHNHQENSFQFSVHTTQEISATRYGSTFPGEKHFFWKVLGIPFHIARHVNSL